MAVTIMQGDSYPIYINLTQDKMVIKPAMVEDVEIHVGEDFRKSYTDGGVQFDETVQQWYIHPTQQETFDFEEGSYEVYARIKYPDTSDIPEKVIGVKLDKVTVKSTYSREVL